MAMMQEGELKMWNDDRGFGFIRVGPGQPDVFLHIGALTPGVRPKVGDRILFSAVPQGGGKGPRATEAAVPGARPAPRRSETAPRPRPDPARPRPSHRRDGELRPLEWSPTVVLVLALTVLCLVGAALFLPVSPIPLVLYPLASLVAFILYAKDKYRAMTGAWRVSEGTLHLVEALGGWPGAFVAQRTMRHKTIKAEYRATFWLIVAAHVGFWGLWLLSPESLTAFFHGLGSR